MNRLASKVLGMSSTRKQDDLFRKTLADFGYEFKDGKLRNIRTGRPFEFVVHEGDQVYNQKHYEALGEVVTEEVYKLLESECGLKKAPVPLKSKQKEPETFIFVSEDVGTNEKLMVLIHGSGVVRAGQWARRLIINDSLESGTQIPYIKKAKKAGYAVLVMNTNDNYRIMKKERVFIKGSKTPECHAHYVWEHYVQSTAAKHIALVAHSYGGCVTTSLFQKFKKDFRKRVFAVAMTDSVHFIHSPSEFKELVKISYNWVTSRHPLGTKLETMEGDIKRVSSGVTAHEETSWASINSVFKFFRVRYRKVVFLQGARGGQAAGESSSSEEDLADDSDVDAGDSAPNREGDSVEEEEEEEEEEEGGAVGGGREGRRGGERGGRGRDGEGSGRRDGEGRGRDGEGSGRREGERGGRGRDGEGSGRRDGEGSGRREGEGRGREGEGSRRREEEGSGRREGEGSSRREEGRGREGEGSKRKGVNGKGREMGGGEGGEREERGIGKGFEARKCHEVSDSGEESESDKEGRGRSGEKGKGREMKKGQKEDEKMDSQMEVDEEEKEEMPIKTSEEEKERNLKKLKKGE